jgi:uncharacterized membrane protein
VDEHTAIQTISSTLGDNAVGLVGGVGIAVAVLYKMLRILKSDKKEDSLSEDQESFRRMLLEQLVEQRNLNALLQKEKNELTEKSDTANAKLRAIKLNLEIFRKILHSTVSDPQITILFNSILSEGSSTRRPELNPRNSGR